MSGSTPDYNTACRIDDAFFRGLVTIHRLRAQWRFRLGMSLLGFTGLLVLIGVFIFKTGSPEQKLSTENESAYISRISDLNKDKRKIAIDSQRPIESQMMASRTFELAELVANVELFWQQVLAQKKSRFLEDLRRSATFVQDVMEGYPMPTPPKERTLIMRTSQGDDRYTYGVKAQAAFGSLAEAESINLSKLRAEMSGLLSILDTVDKKEAEIAKSDLERLDQAHDKADQSKRLLQLKATATQKLKQANSVLAASKEDAISTQERLAQLDADIKEAELKLEAEKEKRNAILFMAWVPGLTVRVGVVVLLLFMTQILLSTYRYTMALSTFYDGIGDAIQLMQPGASSSRWYNIDHLKILSGLLIPGNVKIDPVADPSQHVTDLAKVWIGRGGK